MSARLSVGAELDRSRARVLRRELRRVEALAIATRALSRRDRSSAGLAATLERRGVASAERTRALGVLERAGYVDDARFAAARAAGLAARGYGDGAIRFDLERQGVADEAISATLGALEPEHVRASTFAERRGRSPRTARWLASKGFSVDAVEHALGDDRRRLA